MIYREKDIESLDEGPIYRRLIKQHAIEIKERGWRRWYNWPKYRYKLLKVNKDSLLGRSVHQLCEKYLHLLPKDRRDVYTLLDWLDINLLGKGDMFYNALGGGRWLGYWHPLYYLCPKSNTVKMYLSKTARAVWSKRKMNRSGMTQEERMKRFYKDRAEQRKAVRARRKARKSHSYSMYMWDLLAHNVRIKNQEDELKQQLLAQSLLPLFKALNNP